MRIYNLLKSSMLVLFLCQSSVLHAQHSQGSVEASTVSEDQAVWYLPYAKFKIPFNVQSNSRDLAAVQLWVSTDAGVNWQNHGTVSPVEKKFNFQAAAEGSYLFSVQTVDSSGEIFPSPSPPLKVVIDTTKPDVAVRADTNSIGQLVIEARMFDEYVDLNTATLRVRTNRDSEWQSIGLHRLNQLEGGIYQAKEVIDLPNCREVAIIFSVSDKAENSGEASYVYKIPRTAAGDNEMTLASTGSNTIHFETNNSGFVSTPAESSSNQIPRTDGWQPAAPQSNHSQRANHSQQAPHRLGQRAGEPLGGFGATVQVRTDVMQGATTVQDGDPRTVVMPFGSGHTGSGQLVNRNGPLALEPSSGALGSQQPPSSPRTDRAVAEELPPPPPMSTERRHEVSTSAKSSETADAASEHDVASKGPSASSTGVGGAFHCKSRAFRLDYSIDALGGGTLADVELWGTEDGGHTWEQWGSDPDRESPFEVQVGNDGLFGFRMAVVGSNGLVSNRPKESDSADVWINVDTNAPDVKITRAVYGEGDDDGMLVIDYSCHDGHLTQMPITLSYAESLDGTWHTIVTGHKNSGLYIWKPSPNLPNQIYLRLEAADKAGNVGVHRLELPIDTKGLGPHGRIQGFQPIFSPGK